MLLVLTIERYVSVCHPGHIRRFCPPRVTVALIPVLTFLIYLPSVLRGEVVKCVLQSDGTIMYHKRDNMKFLDSLFYSVSGAFVVFSRALIIHDNLIADLQGDIGDSLQAGPDGANSRF